MSKPVKKKNASTDWDTPKQALEAWTPVILADRDCDWCYFVKIVIFKLKRMRDHELHFGHHDTSARDAAWMDQVAELLEKVANDDYYRGSIEKMDADKQRDLDKALKIISKHLFEWWD